MNAHYTHIIETYATHSPAEQAAALGISRSTALHLRSHAIKAGHVTRGERNRWTPRQDAALIAALRNGDSLEAATRKTRRRVNPTTVQNRILRLGGIGAIRAGYVWSSPQVCRLFDVPPHIVRRWVASGLLAPASTNRRSGAALRFTRAALRAFVADNRAWPDYRPDWIRDPELAAFARGERIKAGGEWIQARAWGLAHGYAAEYGTELARTGKLDRVMFHAGAWFVWQPR